MMQFLFLAVAFALGLLGVLIIRYVGDFLFPWEIKRVDIPGSGINTQALIECFESLHEKYRLDMIMGNMSHHVVEYESVFDSLKNALEKVEKIRIIIGPEIDAESKEMRRIMDNPKIELYRYPSFPELHFRVILNEKGKPVEAYVEDPHPPFHDYGYIHIPSRKIATMYYKLFLRELKRSKNVRIDTFQLIDREDN